MLTTPDNLLFLHLLDDNVQNELLHHPSRDGGEADRPVVPWILLLALFEDWSDTGFSSVLGHLSCPPGPFKESGSAMTSASFLSTCGCITSGPMDLWVCSFLKWSLTQSSSTKGGSSFLQAFSLTPRDWDSQGPALALKTKAKKAFINFVFSVSSITRTPTSFSSSPTLSLVFHLLPMYLKKPFLLSLTSLATFNYRWVLHFLVASLRALTTFLPFKWPVPISTFCRHFYSL